MVEVFIGSDEILTEGVSAYEMNEDVSIEKILSVQAQLSFAKAS
jgi:hypothetical protein